MNGTGFQTNPYHFEENSMSYDNRNRGSIWKNDRKEKETHPDFKGTYTDENGGEYWVSAWKRKPDANPNAPALNFTLQRKEQQAPQQQAVDAQRPVQGPVDEFDDDSIPF